MVDAARQLFEEVGYDEATIRAIARRADCSVGSVFTSFSSKSHVLSEVMQARLTELYPDLERTKLATTLTFLAEVLGAEHPSVVLILNGKNPAAQPGSGVFCVWICDAGDKPRDRLG